MPDSSPNILFIMSDDHTSQAVGAYNSRLAGLNPTPTIDRLFEEGVVFDNTFCTNAICTPSRASILTGQYSQTNGVLDLYDGLPVERQHLPREFKEAGYTTAQFGKWHLRSVPDSFDYYYTLPGQGKYMQPDLYSNQEGTPTEYRFDSQLTLNVNIVENEGHSTDVITDRMLHWLQEDRPKEKSFFCCLHYKAPHDMFDHHPRYNDYLEDVDIPEPGNLYDQPATGFGSIATRGEQDELIHVIGASVSKRNHNRNMGMHMDVDPELPDHEYTHLSYQRYLKKYLRCVKGIDDNLKRVFDALEEQGLMEGTIIVYTGDQGMFLGEHDFIDKRWIYEEAMRMPFLIRYPKGGQAHVRNDWLIDNTDFAPTLLEMAGLPIPDYMQGRSFAGAMSGKDQPENWRSAVYYRYWMHFAHNLNHPAHFGLRTQRYKLVFFYGSDYKDVNGGKVITDQGGNRYHPDTPKAWEFYDLEKDPEEMTNQYGNPEYADIIVDLKVELRELRAELNETDEAYPKIQAILDEYWDD